MILGPGTTMQREAADEPAQAAKAGSVGQSQEEGVG